MRYAKRGAGGGVAGPERHHDSAIPIGGSLGRDQLTAVAETSTHHMTHTILADTEAYR